MSEPQVSNAPKIEATPSLKTGVVKDTSTVDPPKGTIQKDEIPIVEKKIGPATASPYTIQQYGKATTYGRNQKLPLNISMIYFKRYL